MQIHASPLVSQTYPGALAGVLVLEQVTNPASSPELEARKAELQAELCARFISEEAIKADPVIQAYAAYYKRFKKTYHIALQLESVALRGKSIPSVAALVECMFMAELADRMLTAGHDLDTLQGGITVGVSDGSEVYTLLRGVEQQNKPGDLFIRDELGVISSIVYGPDARTQITAATTRAVFTVYAPPGVGEVKVRDHLARILEYARIFSPQARAAQEWIGNSTA